MRPRANMYIARCVLGCIVLDVHCKVANGTTHTHIRGFKENGSGSAHLYHIVCGSMLEGLGISGPLKFPSR